MGPSSYRTGIPIGRERDTRALSLSTHAHEMTQQEDSHLQVTREVTPEISLAGTLILDFEPPEL